jgi:hypothetical protein
MAPRDVAMGGGGMPDEDILGPIDYLAVEFPSGRMTGTGFRLVRDLVRRGVMIVMDLEFVRKEADGTLAKVALEDVPQDDPVDISEWLGLDSGLLDEDDLQALGDAISPGSLAGIMVYENAWAAGIMREIESTGARLLASARIHPDDLLEALGPEGEPG